MISFRLKEILKEILPCNTVIDIGSDHGTLAYHVYLKKLAHKVIASDIRKTCVDQILNKYNGLFDVRLGDGFSVLKEGENDTVIIAGVGGYNIINMLKDKHLDFNRYIFSPHQDVEELRLYLYQNGYNIFIDRIIKDCNKFYNIIVCNKGKINYCYKDIYLGKNELNNKYYVLFLHDELQKQVYIRDSIDKNNKNNIDKLNEVNKKINIIKNELKGN